MSPAAPTPTPTPRPAAAAPAPRPVPGAPAAPSAVRHGRALGRVLPFAGAVYEVARKDFLQHLRTKRALIIGVAMVVTLWLVTVILPVMVFEEGDEAPETGEPSHENLAFLFYLNASVFGGTFMLQLLSIVLTSDAVCSEWQNRTIFLMLSKPVSRTAFVLGKFLGAMATILPLFLVLFSLQYAILQPFYDGAPSGGDVLRFFGMMGMLALGVMAISAMALFFSTLTKSTVQSLVITLLVTFVALPLVGNIGDFAYLADDDRGERDSWQYDWSHYVSPEKVMASAGDVLIEGGEGDFFALSFLIPSFPPARVWLSAVSGVLFTGLFLSLAVTVVNRRNFE